MTEFYTMDIKAAMWDRPKSSKSLMPLIEIYDDFFVLPRLNDEVVQWINANIMNPFYLAAMDDESVDGVSDKDRIIFTHPNDLVLFKLRWNDEYR